MSDIAIPTVPIPLLNQNSNSNSNLNSTSNSTSDHNVIHRKLNGYVGFANLPKQWHRKSIRRGFNFNLMIVGEKGLGKRTLINTLFNKDLYDLSSSNNNNNNNNNITDLDILNDEIKIETLNTEIIENNVKLNLSIINCNGFGDSIDHSKSFEPIINEINSRFDSYLELETKINRSNLIINDNRIHALLYFIEPTGHCLKPLDIHFMKSIHEKVHLIPIIAKSDILNEFEIENLKLKINQDLKNQKINIFQPINYQNDDNETIKINNEIISKIPYAIVGSNQLIKLDDNRLIRGRNYPWGIIEIDNELHCDFIKLRQLLIRNFMEELKDLTNKKLYENYRYNKLIKMGIIQDNSVFKEFDPILKQEEEKKLHELKLSNLENQMKQIFQQKVSREEKKLQETEADLFNKHKEMRDKLLKQIKMLEEKKKDLELSNQQNQQSLQSPQINQQQQQQQPSKTRKGFLRG
jgi:septin 7